MREKFVQKLYKNGCANIISHFFFRQTTRDLSHQLTFDFSVS